jgi:hypothetical protein
MAGTFPSAPLRTAQESFDLTPLSSARCRDLAPRRPCAMTGLMARVADDQGLASARGHAPAPERRFSLPWSAAVRECPDLGHVALRQGSAELTDLRQQALDHLAAWAEDLLWLVVEEDRRVPAAFHATTSRDQGLCALASGVWHLKDRERALRGRHGAPIRAVDPVDAPTVRRREGLPQGPWHDPGDTPPARDVVRPQVGRHEAPIRRLVLRHAAIVAVVETCRPGEGLASAPVGGALGSEDLDRDLQARRAVEAAPSYGPVRWVVGVRRDARVAADARGLCPRVRDHGVGVRERAVERLPPGLPQRPLERCGRLPWAPATQEPLVCGPDVPAAAPGRVGGIACGQALGLPASRRGRSGGPRQPVVPRAVEARPVRRVGSSALAIVIGWPPHRLDEPIPAIQVQLPADGAHAAAWRPAAARRLVAPRLQRSGLEPRGDQAHTALLVAALAEDRQQDRRVQAVEALRAIARDDPWHPLPATGDLSQGGVTAPARAEAGRGWTARRVVIRLQPEADDGLPDWVRPCRQAHGALRRRGCLRDGDALHRGPAIACVTPRVDERVALRQRHGVDGFRGGARGHGATMAVETSIGRESEVTVVALSSDVCPRASASATRSDDAPNGVGVAPLASRTWGVVSSPVPRRPGVGSPPRRRRRGRRHLRARAP